MRIRNGFVSNSSSSSFIVFGIKVTEAQVKKWEASMIKIRELGDEFDLYEFCESIGTPAHSINGKYVIGHTIAQFYDDDMPEEEEADIQKIMRSNEIQELSKITGIPIEDMRIHIGSEEF